MSVRDEDILSHVGVSNSVPTNHILLRKLKFLIILKYNIWKDMIDGDRVQYIKMGQQILITQRFKLVKSGRKLLQILLEST